MLQLSKLWTSANNCKQKEVTCVNCSGHHVKDICEATFKCCANCGNGHPATDRNCPKREEYIRIHKVMILENLNFEEAVKNLSIPEFSAYPNDFPPLQKDTTAPTTQQLTTI